MSTLTVTFAGESVAVDAPTGAAFDPERFRVTWPAGQAYGLDTETTPIEAAEPSSDDPRRGIWYPEFAVRTVQLAQRSPDGLLRAVVLRVDDPRQAEAARCLLADRTTRFVSHSSYDVMAIWRHFAVDLTGRNLDTECLAYLREGSAHRGHGLKELAGELLGDRELARAEEALVDYGRSIAYAAGERGPLRVDEAKVWAFREGDVGRPEFVTYAALDAVATLLLAPVLVRDARASRLTLRMEQFAADAFIGCQIRGKLLDRARTEALYRRAANALAPLEEEIRGITGYSRTQGEKLVAWLVANGLDPESADQTKGGRVALRQDALPKILASETHQLTPDARQVVEALLSCADHIDDRQKAREFLARADEAGRVHPHYRSHGAASGRASASEPNDMNLSQRKGDEQRRCFIPEQGWGLFANDYDQIELRIMAAESGEQHLIDAVVNGADLHQITANQLGIGRSEAKVFNFQIPYGVGAAGLSAALGCSPERGDELLAAWRQENPRLFNWLQTHKRGSGRVVMMSGRTAAPPIGRDGRPSGHARANYHVQGSARDLMWAGWARYRRLGGKGLLWAWLHDEFVVTCPIADMVPEMHRLTEAMTWVWKGMPITTDSWPLLDAQGSYRWMKADSVKNDAAAWATNNGVSAPSGPEWLDIRREAHRRRLQSVA